MPRSALRSKSRPGSTPAFMHAAMNGALVPKYVMPVSCASRHSAFRSGCPGFPSYRMHVEPSSSPPTRKFHIIQPVVLNQKNRSFSVRSRCSESAFRCSTSIPPWLCTMGLGNPVVPDEYSTQSGWSNGTGSKTSSASSPSRSPHRAAPSGSARPPMFSTTTIAFRLGKLRRISSDTPMRSNSRPPYRYPSTVISTVGSICWNRSATLRSPKSGEHDDHTAPMLAVASSAMTASGMFGRYAATRSPRPTPSRRSPAATDATARASSAYVTSPPPPSSFRYSSATCPSRRASACSA